MLVHRASVYRLEPTEEQRLVLAQWAGACRFVYNIALEQRRDFRHLGKSSFVSQCREITQCRRLFPWLAEAPADILQQALRDLDIAFQRFFSGLSNHPRPRQRDRHSTFRLPKAENVGFKRLSKRMGAIKVPKLGWVKCRNWRPLGGQLCNVTIKYKAGHWYAAIKWQRDVALTMKRSAVVGIDRGVAVFAALSNGIQIAPLASFRYIEAKLAKLQRRLARKKKFSANWIKQKAKITRLHRQAANARKDFLHKISTQIAESQGIVRVERLNVQGMSASAKGTEAEPGCNVRAKAGLNKAILDQGWTLFKTMLAYKLVERGGRLEEVEPAYTSQTCAECGVVDRKNRKAQATFSCQHCGHEANADVNAARNILQARALAVEPPKRTLRRVGKRKHREEAAFA